jgi:EAL domain-containing protein (putative c-di-GMP-specific phosphodiesterase class I)
VDVVTDLSRAVSRGEITAAIQPQVDLLTHRVVAVELLARWHHPRYGFVTPDKFIPLAEAHGYIDGISDVIIEQACVLAARWAATPIVVAVNVSASQLSTAHFFDHLQATLARHDVPARLLTLEITETMPITDPAYLALELARPQLAGLGISIDDYGVGYSSAERMAQVSATEVKLDQSLIRAATPDEAALVDVVSTAHDAGLQVVAEGIETREQLHLARRIGCDRGQGYLLGRPMNEADIAELLGS